MSVLRCVFAGLAAALLAPLAAAQDYPNKPIRVILSVPAGATPDLTARLLTPGLSQLLGQQLVVDNRPGAGGLIGAEIASKATPDGYTVFISSPGALTILPHLRKSMPYDTLRDFAPILAHVKAGRLRVLGVAGAKRSPQLPEVPTISEAGVPGFEAVNWFGMFAPAKTPKRIIARLNEAVVKVVRSPETRSQFTALGADAVGSSADEFAEFVRRDMAQYAKIVKLSGAKVD
ncbi:MAG: hypothetical protein A3F74_13215 [Betaproteobacteria bacterium RIFCSPLOWO2_12_FULL_62_58]|nr:MAG: hypothetical protein A3F74_13215 [Betaproteobacteria bacterium RIFCSPLOWO2_12_FULL_62_58]